MIFGGADFLLGLPDWASYIYVQTKHTYQQVLDAAFEIGALQDRLKPWAIEFLFVISPNKDTIYKEYRRQPRHLLHPIFEADSKKCPLPRSRRAAHPGGSWLGICRLTGPLENRHY